MKAPAIGLKKRDEKKKKTLFFFFSFFFWIEYSDSRCLCHFGAGKRHAKKKEIKTKTHAKIF